jgi:hypothetical protein
MEEYRIFINNLANNFSLPLEVIEEHFNAFLAKINPEAPIDLDNLSSEFLLTLLVIKEESDALQKSTR